VNSPGLIACLMALAVVLIAAHAPADNTAPPPGDELVGLWKAKRWFGPDARGPLIIQRTGSTFTADMMGRTVPVRVDRTRLSFELSNGGGKFQGALHGDGAIHGYWNPGQPRAMGGHTTPVTLQPDGRNRWRGQVVPFEDIFTFYLLVEKRPDGTLSALLRNPERDFGALLGAETLTREANVVTLIGRRRGQGEPRAIATGIYDSANAMITLPFPGRGGSYDFRRENEHSEFYPRGRNPARYAYRPPLARGDGWPTGTLGEANIDRAAMEKFIQMIIDMPMNAVDTPQIHSVLIARHGKLVLEEYFHGEHRDKLHETRSAAKSLTATLIGAAMQAGAPLKPSTPVYEVMNGGTFGAGLEPRKRAMTLEHLLTMSSGYFCDDSNDDAPGNEDKMQQQREEPDWLRYTLNVPMAMQPGEKAIYCSANPNLALGMLSRVTGESPLVTFDRLLGRPMKIRTYGWGGDPAGHPYGGGGVQLLPRDFMKLGQLMLNGGTWEGMRILSREFVTRASSPLYRLGTRGYGYLWWVMDYAYKGGTIRSFQALGAGGQIVSVFPDLDLVIASNGANYSSRGWRSFQYDLIPKYILPAVREENRR
jgi:CubicO group peptidase (beta-lactamase class C family)